LKPYEFKDLPKAHHTTCLKQAKICEISPWCDMVSWPAAAALAAILGSSSTTLNPHFAQTQLKKKKTTNAWERYAQGRRYVKKKNRTVEMSVHRILAAWTLLWAASQGSSRAESFLNSPR
jgi:hypothetical protein